jgi:hydrogenase maturation protease
MKPTLVIGLGNPLMGDDGVGWHVAERLASDPRLPESVEAMCGGTDLLRYAGQMEGRSRVIFIDAIQDDAQPGSVLVFGETFPEMDSRQEHAHHLSAVQAIQLLKMMVAAPIALLGISISSAVTQTELSPAVDGRMASILDRVLQELI